MARFAAKLKPQSGRNAIEELWVRDIVDLLWESIRLRRLKAALMRANTHEGLAKLLAPLAPNLFEGNELVRAWFSRLLKNPSLWGR
jgi:hypothetical protein